MEAFLADPLMPFQFGFMRQAFLIGLVVAVPAGLLSCFLVLKGWSLMGDAISHAVLPGVVLAYMAGLPIALGAFVAGMGAALMTGFVTENSRVKEDTVMGVVFSGLFGLGIVLFAAFPSDVHLDHILFGNMLGAGWPDIFEAGGIALVVVALLLAKWRDLMLFIFDPRQASAIGLPVGLLHYGLLAVLSLTIVGALKAVGIILVVALLIAPGAIALMLVRRFSHMLAVAVGLSVGAVFLGVYLSFWLDSAPAPTIVLLLTLGFVLALATRGRRGGMAAAR